MSKNTITTAIVVLAVIIVGWLIYNSSRPPVEPGPPVITPPNGGSATNSDTPTPASGEVVKIGFINPLTGPFAAYGDPVYEGAQLAVKEINNNGGINGQPIQLLVEDDGGDPKQSVTAFTKLATSSKVPIIIGPLSSGCSMATASLADRYEVVQLSTLAGTIDLTTAGDFVFRLYPSSEIGSMYIANAAIKRFHTKRAALLYPDNSFGVTSRQYITEIMQAAGIDLVAIESYNDGDSDFRAQLTKIKAASPDLLLCSAYYDEGAYILIQAKELGLNVPVLGEDGWFGPIADRVGDALGNLYFANVPFGPEQKDNEQMQNFMSAFEELNGHAANSYAAAGHAAVYLAKHAIEEGGYSGPAIKEALYKTELETSFGFVRFDSNGDNAGAVYDLYQLDKDNMAILAP